MFASRDKENRVHAQQTTTAIKRFGQRKPISQQQTPSHKVAKIPFTVRRNDENKSLQRDPQQEKGRTDIREFTTPVATTARAPPRSRVINAGACKTSVLPTHLAEQKSRPSATGRPNERAQSIRTEPIPENVLDPAHSDFCPSPEYCPPPEVPLPDLPPIEDLADIDYEALFGGKRLFRGVGRSYNDDLADDGSSINAAKKDAEYERQMIEQEKCFLDQFKVEALHDLHIMAEPEAEVKRMIACGRKEGVSQSSKLNTVRSKQAAAALTENGTVQFPVLKRPVPRPSAKKPPFSALGIGKSVPLVRKTSVPKMKIVSRSTIGFPKARAVPSILPSKSINTEEKLTEPRQVDETKLDPETFRELYGTPPVDSDMWHRLMDIFLKAEKSPGDSTDNMDSITTKLDVFNLSDLINLPEAEDEVFQLPMPTGTEL